MVECSFITEFEDHIFVTVDADAFFFLHDLITSYLKEKEKMVSKKFCHFFNSKHVFYTFYDTKNKHSNNTEPRGSGDILYNFEVVL